MSGRRRSVRRSSGHLGHSRLSNASGFLNADSNAIEDEEQPGWWKNLENTSLPMRRSTRFSIAQDSEAVLNPDSNMNLSQTPDKWWDHLDSSKSPRVIISRVGRRTSSQKKDKATFLVVAEETEKELSRTSPAEKSIRKKKPQLLKNTRRSVGGKAFTKVLETSDDTSGIGSVHGKQNHAQDSSEGSMLSVHRDSIKKARPLKKSQRKPTGRKASTVYYASTDEDTSKLGSINSEAVHVIEQNQDQQDEDNITVSEHEISVKKHRILQFSKSPRLTKKIHFEAVLASDEESVSENVTASSAIANKRQSVVYATQQNEYPKKHSSRTKNMGRLIRASSISEDQPRTEEKSSRSSNRIMSGKTSEALFSSEEESVFSLNLQIGSDQDVRTTQSAGHLTLENENPNKHSGFAKTMEKSNQTGTRNEDELLTHEKSLGRQRVSGGQNEARSSPNTGAEKRMPESSQAVVVDADRPTNSQSIFDQEKMREIKKVLEEVAKKELASMKNTRIDTYFKPIPTSRRIITTTSRNVIHSNLKKKQSQKPLASVDKAYIVNGLVYKRPRLPRPKKWVTDRLYRHLWKYLEPKYNLRTRVRSEQFVLELTEVVAVTTRRKKYNNYKKDLEALIKDMAQLGIINNRNDFYHFCQDFLPYDFRVKAVPMLLPGTVSNVPYDPETLNTPILEIQ